MKRNRRRIRIWLTMGLTAASLALASSASALVDVSDAGGASSARQVPVVVTHGGFNWGYAIIGVAVGLAAIAAAYVARNHRGRLAASH